MKKVKNAPLEASNVAVLLEHIPIGQTRSIHSLQVKRVEADHYSIEGGPVVDLVDALAQVGSYSGKAHNPDAKAHMRKLEADLREAQEALGMFKTAADEEERAEFGIKALEKAELVLREVDHVEHSGRATPMSMHSAALGYANEARKIGNYVYPLVRRALEKGSAGFRSNPDIGQGYVLANPSAAQREAKMEAMVAKKIAAKLKQEALEAKRAAAPARKAPASKTHQTRWGSPEEMVTMTSERLRYEQALASGAYDMKVGDEVMWQGKKWMIASTFGSRPVLTVELRDAAGNTAGPINPEDFKWLGPKRSNPHVEERGYFYEVLNSSGKPVALTTSKAEAEDVCANPKQLNLPKGTYSYRHVGGKKLVPTTSAGTRARRV